MYNATVQRFFAFSGPMAFVLFFAGLITAGFFPPFSPSMTPEEVVRHYRENHVNILIGMNLMMICGMFVFPYVALTAEQMMRIEGSTPMLAFGQLSAGTMGVLGFTVPGMLFMVAAYREDAPAEIIYFMNDFCWIFMVVPWVFQCMVNICIALAVLGDKSATPIFPRWFGYLSVWIAIMIIPASFLVFVKSGPFAWNGLFPFWIPGGAFGIYFIALTYVLLKAIKRQEAEHKTAMGLA